MRPEVEWAEMRERHRHGESISRLAEEHGLTRNTVRKYVNAVSPPKYSLRGRKPSVLDPYKEYINARLAEYDVSARRILEEVKERGYQGGYGVVKRYVGPIRRDRAVLAEIRFETPPGEQAQVDWVDLGHHMVDGEAKHLSCFAMILGYSRASYAEITDNTRTDTFLQGHVNGIDYVGGSDMYCHASLLPR